MEHEIFQEFTLTEFLKSGLVTLRAGNSLNAILGFGNLGLDAVDPAVPFRSTGGLEIPDIVRELKSELGSTGGGDIDDISLSETIITCEHSSIDWRLSCM